MLAKYMAKLAPMTGEMRWAVREFFLRGRKGGMGRKVAGKARRWIEGLGWFDDPAQISAPKHWFGQGRR
jgi:hypothetical protein